MNNVEDIKLRLAKEGYSQIDVYTDNPNEYFVDHTHDGDQLMVSVTGNIVVKMPDGTHDLTPGIELFIPSKTIHSATVGASGCTYVVAEKSTKI